MTQPDLNITTALEAIAEGMNILQLLACATDNLQWIDDSVPLSKLNELAQSLGYRDAQSVHSQVEHDKDMEECHAKVRQLRTELAQTEFQLAQLTGAERAFVEATARAQRAELGIEHTEMLAQLVTPELAALLGRLANCTLPSEHGNAPDVRQCIKDREAARALAAHIREALEASDD
jgi:16S rRNA G1207 methylase RsmC